MKLFKSYNIRRKIKNYFLRIADKRDPDFIIENKNGIYLSRWWIIPRNAYFNIYLHKFTDSDEDRAPHDHMYMNVSYLIQGVYVEHIRQQDGTSIKSLRYSGDLLIRPSGKIAHRIELIGKETWTLFITGPRYREWGFWCKDGWVHWKTFLEPTDDKPLGKGCE